MSNITEKSSIYSDLAAHIRQLEKKESDYNQVLLMTKANINLITMETLAEAAGIEDISTATPEEILTKISEISALTQDQKDAIQTNIDNMNQNKANAKADLVSGLTATKTQLERVIDEQSTEFPDDLAEANTLLQEYIDTINYYK